MTITANVQNLPVGTVEQHLAKNNGVVWLTATPYQGELWYYGLWYTEADATTVAKAEDLVVLKVEG